MATATKKTTAKSASCKAAVKAEKPKKISKLGKWMRENPNRRDDVIIYDQSILYR
jgi:hypothetical protein